MRDDARAARDRKRKRPYLFDGTTPPTPIHEPDTVWQVLTLAALLDGQQMPAGRIRELFEALCGDGDVGERCPSVRCCEKRHTARRVSNGPPTLLAFLATVTQHLLDNQAAQAVAHEHQSTRPNPVVQHPLDQARRSLW
ncbi:hypothetical protein AWN90_07570 [Nocardia terpenica]|uniref:Uncharacterized protein n=1 Tax=Nocardia terpenica TaxID=455432 RepID=A0A164IPG4_9NOCA|nr:hypothetical protein AWN90_07570 [Nocardia terpenica]